MNRYVTVKSNKYGLVLYLNSDIAFETLRREVERTFKGTAGFFGKSRLAVSFEGRILTKEQEQQLIEAISKNAQLEIVCIIDNDEKREKMYKRAVEDTLFPEYGKDGIFCKGTLHKNQVLESETSIVILGDVEKGATVAAKPLRKSICRDWRSFRFLHPVIHDASTKDTDWKRESAYSRRRNVYYAANCHSCEGYASISSFSECAANIQEE